MPAFEEDIGTDEPGEQSDDNQPCPFCAEARELRAEHVDLFSFAIHCNNCLAHGPAAASIKEAWNEWNERLGC